MLASVSWPWRSSSIWGQNAMSDPENTFSAHLSWLYTACPGRKRAWWDPPACLSPRASSWPLASCSVSPLAQKEGGWLWSRWPVQPPRILQGACTAPPRPPVNSRLIQNYLELGNPLGRKFRNKIQIRRKHSGVRFSGMKETEKASHLSTRQDSGESP